MDGIDLRFEMKSLLDEYSDQALLVRSKANACSCVESLSRSPQADCKRCLGTGKIHTAEKIRIRSKQSSSTDTLPKNLTSKSVGEVAVGVREFYMANTIRIKQGDYLLYCEWSGNIPLLNEYSIFYKILNVDPLKGDLGRIEYLKATSESDPINLRAKFNGLINNINGYEYYLAIRED